MSNHSISKRSYLKSQKNSKIRTLDWRARINRAISRDPVPGLAAIDRTPV